MYKYKNKFIMFFIFFFCEILKTLFPEITLIRSYLIHLHYSQNKEKKAK